MLNNFFNSNILIEELKLKCISIIEKELDIFFKSCIKSAYAYSIMISKDIKSFDKESFEKVVLSKEEIDFTLGNIISHINDTIKEYLIYSFININDTNENICSNNTLNDTIKTFETTQKITKLSENIIDNSILKTIQSIYSNKVLNYLFGKINFGEQILGKNSYKNQIRKQEEQIYKQIEGILINTKIDIRNSLIQSTVENINTINTYSDIIYSIA